MVDVEIEFDRIRRGVWGGPQATKPYIEWNDLSRVLTSLLEWTKSHEVRLKFDEVMYNSIKDLLNFAKTDVEKKVKTISTITQRDVDTVTVTMIATANIIRLLRNSVAGVPQNQFLQVKTGLLDTLMDCTCFYYSVTEKCHREKHKYPYAMVYSPISVQVIRASLQVISNLCVGNQAVQGAVWKRLYPTMFSTLLKSIDTKVCDFTCVILFHCTGWIGSPYADALFENQNGQQIVLTSLKLCEQPNCLEWATMFIEGLICASHFISVYELCQNTPLSYTLLEILAAKLESKPSPMKKKAFGEIESAIPVTSFLYLAKLVARHKDDLISLGTGKEVTDGGGPVRMMHILGDVTSRIGEFDRVRCNTPFLQCIVGILIEVNRRVPVKFDTDRSLDVTPDASFGIRRGLIRIITNMSCKNKTHQDKVRELGGLEAVLNHCVVDKQNPYMPQWAIFAVRMLTDDNDDNKAWVASLKSQGVVQDDELKKLGIEHRLEGDKVRTEIIHPVDM